MPAIRGIYYNHPQTDEPGIWIWCDWGNKAIVGISQEQLDKIKLVGNADKRQLMLKTTVENGLLSKCEYRKALVGWTPQELEDKATKPPPHCTIDVNTSELILQPIVITIIPLSLNSPRRLQIEVSDGAYTSNTKYG